jgi:hypothetical protein
MMPLSAGRTGFSVTVDPPLQVTVFARSHLSRLNGRYPRRPRFMHSTRCLSHRCNDCDREGKSLSLFGYDGSQSKERGA